MGKSFIRFVGSRRLFCFIKTCMIPQVKKKKNFKKIEATSTLAKSSAQISFELSKDLHNPQTRFHVLASTLLEQEKLLFRKNVTLALYKPKTRYHNHRMNKAVFLI